MLAGYVYVWRKGVLDWGHRAQDEMPKCQVPIAAATADAES